MIDRQKYETEIRELIVNAYEKLIENYMQKYELAVPYEIKKSLGNGGSLTVEVEGVVTPIKASQLRRNFQLLIQPGTYTSYKSRFDLYLQYNVADALSDIYDGKKLEKVLEEIPLRLEGGRFLENKIDPPAKIIPPFNV